MQRLGSLAVKLVLALALASGLARSLIAGPVEAQARLLFLAQEQLIEALGFEPSDRQRPLGGKNEKFIVRDTLGETWIFKFVDAVRPISVRAELAAGALSSLAGGRVPEVHAVTLSVNGASVYGSIQRMLPLTGTLADRSPESLPAGLQAQLLEDQVFDWMAGDFDTKGENKGVLDDGKLVNLDKTQFQRFFGKEKLDWEFHPNARPGNLPAFNAWIEPYANKLWKAWIAGRVTIDPTPLARAIERWELIEDQAVAQAVRGFARVRSMMLVDGPEVPAERFVSAIVQRKRSLRADFTRFLERAGERRGIPPLTLPAPAPKARVERDQLARIAGELSEIQRRLNALAFTTRKGRAIRGDLRVPLDQEGRLRLIKFKTSSEPYDRVIADLREMRARRDNPMARAGIDEYLERLRRFAAGEVPRERLEAVQHGRGY